MNNRQSEEVVEKLHITFLSRLSSPSVELMLSYSLVLVGLDLLFLTESCTRVFSALESSLSVSGTASLKSAGKRWLMESLYPSKGPNTWGCDLYFHI